tara:strand:+ start:939 stop:1187 length:249 start_codon:yes stop_codon:yes gene_type:complete
MNVVLPWVHDDNCTTVTQINLSSYPYLLTTKKGVSRMLTREEIILRLEAAIYDKDWAAVELLLEDLQIEDYEEDDDYGGDFE